MNKSAWKTAYDGITPDTDTKEELWDAILREAEHEPAEKTLGRSTRKALRFLLVAAVLVTLLTAGIFAKDYFGLGSVMIPESVGNNKYGEEHVNSAEFSQNEVFDGPDWAMEWMENSERALKEWDSYKKERLAVIQEQDEERYNDIMAKLGGYAGYPYYYLVWDEEGANKLEEIAQKYGLITRGTGEVLYGDGNDEELNAELSAGSCEGNIYRVTPQFDHAQRFSSGAIQSSADIPLSDGRRMNSYLYTTMYNEMVRGHGAGFGTPDYTKMTTRNYVTADGTQLTVAEDKENNTAFVYAYLERCYVTLALQIDNYRERVPDGASWEERQALMEADRSLSEEIVNETLEAINFAGLGKGGVS